MAKMHRGEEMQTGGKNTHTGSYDSSFCCSSHHWRDQLLFYIKPCHFSRETANKTSCIHGCRPTNHARSLNSPNKKEATLTKKHTYILLNKDVGMESVPMRKWQCILGWFSPWFWILCHFWHCSFIICPINALRCKRRLNITCRFL